GNIGFAFSDYAGQTKGDVILEVSSFQLDHIHTFKPKISVILNITPDHLDRYGGKLENYAASKFRITENQNLEDTFIYNFDDPLLKKHIAAIHAKEVHPQCWAFSIQNEVPEGAFVRDQ